MNPRPFASAAILCFSIGALLLVWWVAYLTR